MRRFLCLCGAGLLAVALTAGFGCANSVATVRTSNQPSEAFVARTQVLTHVKHRRHHRRSRTFYLPRTVPTYYGGTAVYRYAPPTIVVSPVVVIPANGFTLVTPPAFGEPVLINGIRYVPAPAGR